MVAPCTGRARVRLFCLPYAGGSAAAFRNWPALVPSEVQICPLHLPGRERRYREPIHTHAQSLAAMLHRELTAHLGDVPFGVFGHSMGGVIAYELTRLLVQSGTPPLHLFVSGRRAPRCPATTTMMHLLPDGEFVAMVRELDGLPDEVLRDPQLMEMLLPILRADFQLSETYRYHDGPPLSCPVSALGGLCDPRVSRDELLAWKAQTLGEFRLRLFPGGHFFLRQAEREVVSAVTEDLCRVGSERGEIPSSRSRDAHASTGAS
jgi:medium-chain acyl-[acyl-carrier-protein] hydrolase